MADDVGAKHGAIILRTNFHKWVENALKVKKLSNKDRENILLAQDAFDLAFFDVLDFISAEPTGSLGEIVFRLMLYSAALGQLSPKAEIQKLILKDVEWSKKKDNLDKAKAKKNKPKFEILKNIVEKYIPEFIKDGRKLSGRLHEKIWLDVHRHLKTPEDEIKTNQKKPKLPWPNWQNVRDAIDSAIENDCDQSN
jgi:hypothetical protein